MWLQQEVHRSTPLPPPPRSHILSSRLYFNSIKQMTIHTVFFFFQEGEQVLPRTVLPHHCALQVCPKVKFDLNADSFI